MQISRHTLAYVKKKPYLCVVIRTVDHREKGSQSTMVTRTQREEESRKAWRELAEEWLEALEETRITTMENN